MPENTRKITARLLILILLAVQLTVELAHQHATPNARHPVKSLTRQIQAELPQQRPVPTLCLACLFSSANQSLLSDLAFVIFFSPVTVVAPTLLYLFPQFYQIFSRNRAPPMGEWI